ncbi:CAP-GLY domain-containing linker protein 1 [Rhizophlyctis rosea]|nr:CAP-GLY domain-containing linker protein 1 [Rhizophlyctis rosea]
MAQTTSNSIILDPCCGSGVILRLAEELGRAGVTIGADIQDLHMEEAASAADRCLIDIAHSAWRVGRLFDAIVTDLPYNIRADIVQQGAEGDSISLVKHLVRSAMVLASNSLVPNGRLCFWFRSLDQSQRDWGLNDWIVEMASQHSMTKVGSFDDHRQPFGRSLWVFERAADGNGFIPHIPPRPPIDYTFPTLIRGSSYFNDPAGPGSLFESVRQDDLLVFQRKVVQAEADGIDIRSLFDKKGKSLLHYAAGYGREALASHLLDECGADANVRAESSGITPLMMAAQRGHVDVGRVLLEHGAEFGMVDETGRASTEMACGFGHDAFMKLLADRCSESNEFLSSLFSGDAGQSSCLLNAARYGHLECIKIMLKLGETDILGGVNATSIAEAFRASCRWGHIPVVHFMLDHIVYDAADEADPISGETALHAAATYGREDFANPITTHKSYLISDDSLTSCKIVSSFNMLAAAKAALSPAKKEKSPTPDASPSFQVGDTVRIKTTTTWGKLAFLGTTEFAKGQWAGVALAQEGMGKNDGSVNGVRYFECPEKSGVFVRPETLDTVEFGEDGKPILERPTTTANGKGRSTSAVKNGLATKPHVTRSISATTVTSTAPKVAPRPKAATPTTVTKPPVAKSPVATKSVRRVPSSANGIASPKKEQVDKDVTILEKKIKELEAQNEALKAQVIEAEKKAVEVGEQQIQQRPRAGTEDELHGQLTEARLALEHARAEWTVREEELERKLKAAADRSALEESADDNAPKDNGVVADALLEVQNALSALQAQYDACVKERAAVEGDKEGLYKAIAALEADLQEKATLIKSLEDQLEGKVNAAKETETLKAELEAAEQVVKAAEAKAAELEAKIASLEAARAEAKDVVAQYDLLKAQYQQLQQAHHTLTANFETLSAEVESARQTIAASRDVPAAASDATQNDDIQQHIAALRAQFEEETAGYENTIKEKEWYASNLEGQIEELQLHLGKGGDRVTELEGVLAEKEAKIAELQKLVEEKAGERTVPVAEGAEAEDLKLELEEKTTLVQTLQLQLNELLSGNDADAKFKLEQEVTELRTSVEALKLQLETAQHGEADALKLIEHSRQEYENAVSHFAELEQQKAALEAQLAAKDQEIAQLSKPEVAAEVPQ